MEDTIAAVATAYGEGGIGIIRISGENSLNILKEIFEFSGSSCEFQNRRMTYGKIVDRDEQQGNRRGFGRLHEGPKPIRLSDVVEINCHGSIISLRKTLFSCSQEGSSPAERENLQRGLF